MIYSVTWASQTYPSRCGVERNVKVDVKMSSVQDLTLVLFSVVDVAM